MQVVRDVFDNDVAIGGAIIHASRKSSSLHLRYGIVYGFIWRGDNNWQARVVLLRKNWRGIYKAYKATLTVNNFISIPLDAIPEIHRKILLLKIEA